MNRKKTLIILVLLLLSAGIIMLTYGMKYFRTGWTTRAESREITIPLTNESSPIQHSVGVVVADIADAQVVGDVRNSFGNTQMYIKLINPTAEQIRIDNFQTLSNDGFRWYLTFSSYDQADTALRAYYEKLDKEVVVEISSFDDLNKSATENLKNKYPKIKFHAAQFSPFPRDKIRAIFTDKSINPPLIEAVSMTDINGNSVFCNIWLINATYFDFAHDVAGGEAKINYPDNIFTAISNITNKGDSVMEQARRIGTISVSIFTNVTGGDAPMRYTIMGDISKMAPEEKKILKVYADLVKTQSKIVWPMASSGNGDPWYGVMNQCSDSNNEEKTDPLIGIFGKRSDGKYYGVLTNSKNKTVTAVLNSSIDTSGYTVHSNIRGTGNFISNNKIDFQPYESVAFTPDSSGTVEPSMTPTGIIEPTITPGGTTPTSTPALTLTVAPPTVTNTPVPTETPLPTATSTPVPTSTLVHTATYTPVPTSTPRPTYTIQPTYTVQPPYSGPTSYVVKYVATSESSSLNSSSVSSTISDVTVNGQKPGIAPWMYILGPIVLVLVGILL